MSEYESYKIKQDSNKYLTEEEIRALLNSTLNNLSTPIRLVAGSIQGTGADPWELTPSEMNIELSENSEQSIQGWTNTLTFSSVDYNTVQWTSGDITLSGGKVYSITEGNTGNMSALTYIYLDVGVSETALQTTTTASDSVGSGKILIAVAENNSDSTSDAIFQVFGGSGGILLTTDNLAANSITANEISANTITANEIAAKTITASEMNVSKLSAISANLGTITAGIVTGATIQTRTTGTRVVMTNNEYIYFRDGSTEKGKIYTDANYDLNLSGTDDVVMHAGGAARCGAHSNSFKPLSSQAYDLGSDGNRWRYVHAYQYHAWGKPGYNAGGEIEKGFVYRIDQQRSGGYVTNIRLMKRYITICGGIITSSRDGDWEDAE